MGMFDHIVVLDESLQCPHGHLVNGLQTKSFADPSMATYLVEGPRVYLVAHGGFGEDVQATHWHVEGSEAVFQRRHAVEPIVPPREVVFYSWCDGCAPVLVRCDHVRAWCDLVEERHLWVEFQATFDSAGRRQIDRTSGTRDDLVTELRASGLRVLRDDEPLAIAHYEARAARDAPPRRLRTRR